MVLTMLAFPKARALNGEIVEPRVSSILQYTQPESTKRSLAHWRAAVGDATAKQIMERATKHGSRAHSEIESILNHGNQPSECPYIQAVSGYLEEVKQDHFETECSMIHTGLMYRGTADLIRQAPADRWMPGAGSEIVTGIEDWKTALKHKSGYLEDHCLQLIAYSLMYEHMFPDQPKVRFIRINRLHKTRKDANEVVLEQFTYQLTELWLLTQNWLDNVAIFWKHHTPVYS
jgi:hypothetical protein